MADEHAVGAGVRHERQSVARLFNVPHRQLVLDAVDAALGQELVGAPVDAFREVTDGLAAFEPLPAVERRTPLFFAVRRLCFLGWIALPDGAANLLEPRLDYFATALGFENRRRSLACTQQRRDVDVIKVL